MSLTQPPWELRFRAVRHTLPAWAKQRPDRCVFVSDAAGVAQIYCWDLTRRLVRQVTDRSGGTRHCAIPSSGRSVWWFADTDGDEYGVWLSQPFDGGPTTAAVVDLEPAWMAGLVLGMDDHALVGRSTEAGSEIRLVRPDGHSVPIYQHDEPAFPVDLSRDLQLVAVEHSEDSDLLHTGVRVLTTEGALLRDLVAGEGRLDAIGFVPVRGDCRLLLMRSQDDVRTPCVLDPQSGELIEIRTGLTGELDAAWWADGTGLLLLHGEHARSDLFHYDLRSATLNPLRVPPGTIQDAASRPDGTVWYLWSSSVIPPRFGSTGAPPDLPMPALRPPESVSVDMAWVPGPGGPIHTLITRAPVRPEPGPAVMLLHGGPDDQDVDDFSPEVAAWVEHGFTVLRPNYRGSSGYGMAWSDAIREQVGFVELDDVDAVRSWAIDEGLADPDRLVLAGSSWGGYLTLLGLCTQPDAWAVGLADSPVADLVAAYEDEMEEMRALDRALFGGSPQDMPERYRIASPMTYARFLRAPVLISAGERDPRCPIRQVEAFVAHLAELGRPHEFYRHGAGHSTTAVEERIALFRRQVDFVRGHLSVDARMAGTVGG